EKSSIARSSKLLPTDKIGETLRMAQILERSLNQINLGHRSYGFAAASRTYYGKPLSEVTVAEAALLAGIPKAPSRFNPRANMKRAIARQHYVLERMEKLGYITPEQHQQALAQKIVLRDNTIETPETTFARHGQYVAELARQLMYNVYKDNVYGRGLSVYTTIRSEDQEAAYHAVRDGIMSYTRRKPYPGPAAQVDLPAGIENDTERFDLALEDIRNKYRDSDDLVTAVVLSASATKVTAARTPEQIFELSGKSLGYVKRALVNTGPVSRRIQRGSVIYLQKVDNAWTIINMPRVEGAFISLNPQNGAIDSMIGGFDFNRGDFNRVTQAWRDR